MSTTTIQNRGRIPSDSPQGRLINSTHSEELSKLRIVWGDPGVNARITAHVKILNDDIDGQNVNDLLAGIEFNDDAIARRLVEMENDGADILGVTGTIEAGESIPYAMPDGIRFEFDIKVEALLRWPQLASV